ncbi:hypothetical protein HDE_13027 [Halotydeus destructor]|nr:hypothetical protein HDE_13027 [Halotydeus destructor]
MSSKLFTVEYNTMVNPLIPFRLATGLAAGKSLALNLAAIPALRTLDNPTEPFKIMYKNSTIICNVLALTGTGFGLYYWKLTGDDFALLATGLMGATIPVAYMFLPDIRKYRALSGPSPADGAPVLPGARLEVKEDIETWSNVHWAGAAMAGTAFAISLIFLPY